MGTRQLLLSFGVFAVLCLSDVVRSQTNVCTDDTCVRSVELQRQVMQQNVSISGTAFCSVWTTSLNSMMSQCRQAWNTNKCSSTSTSSLDARLQYVGNYISSTCDPSAYCDSPKVTQVRQNISNCQTTFINAFRASTTTLSRNNICQLLQSTLNCITTASSQCSSTKVTAGYELLYDVFFGSLFDCEMAVQGTAVIMNYIPKCSFPTFAKCYNPILSAIRSTTIDDNFDYNYLNQFDSGLNVYDIFDYSKANDYCTQVASVNWNSVRTCITNASPNCAAIFGDGPDFPIGTMSPLLDDIFKYYTTNLKYLETLEYTCSSGCTNIQQRAAKRDNCPTMLPIAQNIVAQTTANGDTTALCGSLRQALTCVNSNNSGCDTLLEDVYYSTLGNTAQDFLTTKTAIFLCGLTVDAKLPWEVCRKNDVAQDGVQIETSCVAPGLALRSTQYGLAPTIDYVKQSINIMYNCFAKWSCAQNEAIYVQKLHTFADLIAYNYPSNVTISMNKIPVNKLLGGPLCDMQAYGQCFNPLLTATGARFDGTMSGLYPFSAILASSTSVQPLCQNLTNLNLDGIMNCAQSRLANCKLPFIAITDPINKPITDLSRRIDKFYPTDLPAIKTWINSICTPNCSGIAFTISAQQISQCIYWGNGDSRIVDQSQQAILASFLGNPIGPYCRNLSDVADCLNNVASGCQYLLQIRDKLLTSIEYKVAYAICLAVPGSFSTTPPYVDNGGASSSTGSGNAVISSTTTVSHNNGGGDHNGGYNTACSRSVPGVIGLVLAYILATAGVHLLQGLASTEQLI